MNQTGAMIESGPADWQIIQRGADGYGSIALRGRWVNGAGAMPGGDPSFGGVVEVRLADEGTGVAVSDALDWHAATTREDGTWETVLERIPAGGLYRLETRFHAANNPLAEWSERGDMRHFLGVGDLWVIAGQSNSAGYGRGPMFDPPELGVHLFRNSMTWSLASHPLNESTDTLHPVNREFANPGHGPQLHFARLVKQALGIPIGLVQTALGGSPLSAWHPGEGGELFRNMVDCVEAVGGRVTGVLWYQGESDAAGLLGASYEQRLAETVAGWRAALNAPGLPVIATQLNRYLVEQPDEVHRSWSMVREAQRRLVQTLPGFYVVPALDLPLSDNIHTSPAGNMLLGERMARAALGGVYGRPLRYRAPDVRSARRSEDGCTVELTFADVTSRMDNIDLLAQPFVVEDADGVAPVAAVTYPGGAMVCVQLSRPLSGRGFVHGGYGAASATVPIDVEAFLPMLGFYGLEIE